MDEVNYDIMRYELDSEGYILNVYFGCASGTCAGYTGEIPDGYETIEEWHESEFERLNAWKIVEGNLVFDANKCDEIQNKAAIENEENSYVTHKELNAVKIEQDENLRSLYDEKSIENTYLNRLNVINNSANMNVEKVDIRTNTTITDDVKLFFTSANMLPNQLTSKEVEGIRFTQNNDRSIQINGGLNLKGNNLFNLGLVHSSYNPSDRGFTLKNRFAAQVIFPDDIPKIMKPNTTYTIKVISKIIDKPTTIGANITYDLALYRPESETLAQFWRNLNSYEKNSKNVGDVTTTYTQFTTPSDLTNLGIRGYSFYGNNDGSTTYKGVGEVEIQEIMLVEGVYNESNFPEFEPYFSKNLFINGGTFSNNSFHGALDTENTLNGNYSIKTEKAWQGLHLNLKDIISNNNLKIGDTVTYSIYFKTNFIPTKGMRFVLYRGNQDVTASKTISKDTVVVGEWQRISFTFDITEYSLTATTTRIEAEYWDANDPYFFGNNRTNYIWYACPQFQVGELTYYEPYEEILYEIDFAGTSKQTESIFYFLKNIGYLLNGLNSNLRLRFYDYDGTDRTLIGEYGNDDVILWEEDKKVTQISLCITTRNKLNTTIYPMLQEVDQLALDSGEITPYETYKSNSLKVSLGDNEINSSDNLIIEKETVSLIKNRFITIDSKLNSSYTLYFNFPDDLYKVLPSEETTIIKWGSSSAYPNRIYVKDKKVYLQYYKTQDNAHLTVLIYDNETQKNLTSYKITASSSIWSDKVTEINTILDIYSYVTYDEIDNLETIDLGSVKMPSTYYKITNVYTDKVTEAIVFYRNIEKLNTEVVKIGTFTINDNSLTSDITTEYDFTEDDLNKVRQYILGQTTLTYTEKLKYDTNEDGVINPQDLLAIRNLILANISSSEPGHLEINSSSPYKTILIKDKDGNEVINLSLLGLKIKGEPIEPVEDTGWLELECSSSCADGGYSGTPQYRKIGNHVYVRGSVLVTLSSSTVTLATLPEEFRPSHFFYKVNMAQGNCIWRQTVSDNGNINCEWVIDTVAGSKKTSGTAWVELNIDFLTD